MSMAAWVTGVFRHEIIGKLLYPGPGVKDKEDIPRETEADAGGVSPVSRRSSARHRQGPAHSPEGKPDQPSMISERYRISVSSCGDLVIEPSAPAARAS